MHKALMIAGLASLTLAAQAATAANGSSDGAISYDYLEANYETADFDGLPGSDPDGFGLVEVTLHADQRRIDRLICQGSARG